MKKIRRLFISLFLMIIFLNGNAYAAKNFSLITDKKDNGLIEVKASDLQSKAKVMVQKGNTKYYYNIENNVEKIPLQLGNGKYTISLLENISNNKYKVVDKEELDVDIKDSKNVFLQSTKIVSWEDTKAKQLAKELTKNKTIDEEKIAAIYDYVVNNISYDWDKIKNIKNNYVPNINEILKSKEGICYDYSSVFAGMLRSVGIPTKLVMGYKNDIKTYHAWNEVYINGKWIIIDTTYDSAYMKAGSDDYTMVKSENDYTTDKEY